MIVYVAVGMWDGNAVKFFGAFNTEELARDSCQADAEYYDDTITGWHDTRDSSHNYINTISRADNREYGILEFTIDKDVQK